jgi:hypothetical protein
MDSYVKWSTKKQTWYTNVKIHVVQEKNTHVNDNSQLEIHEFYSMSKQK